MNEKTKSKVTKYLKLDFSDTEIIWLSTQKTLRRLIGILGISLPCLLILFLFINTGYKYPLYSISHYYYTRIGSVFIIIVSMLAFFLLVYKGRDPIDFYVSTIAGLCALSLVLFPTDNISQKYLEECPKCNVTILNDFPFRTLFHYIMSAGFLICLAFISIFIFTKSNLPSKLRTKQKRIRNRFFRSCGFIMLFAILVVFPGSQFINEDFYTKYDITFWMETIAVVAFGISWIIKGEMILKDKLPK
ncbi:MAG: hypothetical protein WBP31_15155 [Chitinophagales bacterium]|nr:hypothetical protein [Bacteroidota bacterium]MBP9880448.1 hypothetical protein [Chitinophagales bacterium]